MPGPSLQLTFGAFGDIVTLIDLVLKVKDCLTDGTRMRDEVQEFVHFLDRYMETMRCIGFVLSSASSKLPTSLTNAILHALVESKKFVQHFLNQLNSFKPLQWWGATIAQAIRWSLYSKHTLQELQKKLMDQGNSITTLLSLSGLQTTLDLASSADYQTLPSQPQSYTIRLVDFLDQHTHIPLECCISQATFDRFLLFYFQSRAGLEFIKRGDYEVHCSDWKSRRRRWNVRLGEILNMSAILRSNETDDRRCPKCHRLNSNSIPEYDGELKCSYCQTFFRVADSRFQDLDSSAQNSTYSYFRAPNMGSPARSYKVENDVDKEDLQYIRRILVHPIATPNLVTTSTGPIKLGTLTYTLTESSDGSFAYHPFRAEPVCYQTPDGIAIGIQWIPCDPRDFIPGTTEQLHDKSRHILRDAIVLSRPTDLKGNCPNDESPHELDDFPHLRRPTKPGVSDVEGFK